MFGLSGGQIYKITCIETGKIYIGQTTYSLKERWRNHLRQKAEDDKGSLGEAVRMYGEQGFEVETICIVQNESHLHDLEKFYIEKYDCMEPKGFNRTEGGLAFVRTKNHAERISRSHIGKKFTETPKPMKNAYKGQRRRNVLQMKPVIGTHLETGETIELAGLSVDDRFDPRLISAVCKGKRWHHRGYRWEYKTE